ncbi:MAG TPA: universal stress protein, partial [Kofleriaceae bacterium]|nr:universal stress protein [Kofleriaceae bacterium]
MSIICGTDLSEASSGALDVARALAAQRGDREVILVHVVDPEASDGDADVDATLDARRTRLEAQAAAAAAAPPGPRVRVELVIGPIEQTLVGLAETEASDLIVVAAQSRREPVPRLGATAGKVIALTHVPVIIVRDPAPWIAFARGTRPLRVLLGIDDSATCDLGVQWTLALAVRGPIDVVLGAIYYPDDAAAYYGLPARSLVETDPEIERLMQR